MAAQPHAREALTLGFVTPCSLCPYPVEAMQSEEIHLPSVEVHPAAPEEEPVLANLLELYSHDFSEFIDLPLQPDGRFGYPRLALYWREESRHPFLVRMDGQLAGFALVSRGSHIGGDPQVWDMTEFFILRGYRRRGIGAAVAREIWRRLPGPWEVRVIESNQAAQAFWSAVIEAFTSARARETTTAEQGKHWRVFSFTSPASSPA